MPVTILLAPYNSPMTDALIDPPYAGLTPDVVLDALESVGLPCDGRQLALNSYENRVYQVGIEGGASVVVKFYRPGRWNDVQIAEEHAFVGELDAHEIPVVPPTVFGGTTLNVHAGFRFAVFPRRGGRAPDLGNPDVLEWLGRFMGRIHAVGAIRPFVERPALDCTTFGVESRDWLLAHEFVPADLRAGWICTVAQALENVEHCYRRAGTVSNIRLHGDCHVGNVLWTEEGAARGPHFVDFDDARSGPAIQDLWMLLPTPDEMPTALKHLLKGYEDFSDFNDDELYLTEALRTLRLLHYSAWLARRWNDPAFPAAFPWFNTPRYWEARILELKEQVALMQEPPARPA